MLSKRFITRITKLMYVFGIIFLLTGMLLSAVSFPALAEGEQPSEPAKKPGDTDPHPIDPACPDPGADYEYLGKDEFSGDGFLFTSDKSIDFVFVKAGNTCFAFTADGNDGCYQVSGIGTNSVSAVKTMPDGESRVGEDEVICHAISHISAYHNNTIPLEPELYVTVTAKGTDCGAASFDVVVQNAGAGAAYGVELNLSATGAASGEPTPAFVNIGDLAAGANSAVIQVNVPADWDLDDFITLFAVVTDDNQNTATHDDTASDPGNCNYDPCEWNPAIPSDDPACKPPRELFNLTSMCKIDTGTGQLRVRNQSAYDYEYSLVRVGGAESYTGTAPAGADILVEVPWYGSSDTWKLSIAGHEFVKAIGNNAYCEPCAWDATLPAGDPGCVPPPPPREFFNLTSMCKIDTVTGQMRIRNQSEQDFEYTLWRVGGAESYTGTALAGADVLVEVPWYSGSDTWKLSIAGHEFVKAIGNNQFCSPCEWNPLIPSDDPECKPPREVFNLTSMCKVDFVTGQMRVRNQSNLDYEFTLWLVGGTEVYTGTALANTDVLVQVPWYGSSNTWKLAIAGYEFVKAIGDNELCNPPSQDQFNLTSMCKPNPNTGQLRVRNQSDFDYSYKLYRVGGSEMYEGTAPADTDVLVEVPWYGSSDTWKLEIAGYTFTKAIGNNALCEPPDQADFNLTSMCRIDSVTGQLRVRNQSEYDFAYKLYRYGGVEVYEGTAPAGADVLVEVPWYSGSDTWKLEIAGYTFTKAIGDNPFCEPCEWNETLSADDPTCQMPIPEIKLSGIDKASCETGNGECVTFTLNISGLLLGKVEFTTISASESGSLSETGEPYALLGDVVEFTQDGEYQITVCGIPWPGIGMGFEYMEYVVDASAEWVYDQIDSEAKNASAKVFFDPEDSTCALPDLSLLIQDPFCYATSDGYKMAWKVENPTVYDIEFVWSVNGGARQANVAHASELVWLDNMELGKLYEVTVTWGAGESTTLKAKINPSDCQMPTPPPPTPPNNPPVPVTAVEQPPAPVVDAGILIPVTGVSSASLWNLGFINDLLIYLGLAFLGAAFITYSLRSRF